MAKKEQPGGGGREEKAKTKINLLRPEDAWHPHIGAPRGNRNALTTGVHTGAMRARAAEFRAFKRRARALIRSANILAAQMHLDAQTGAERRMPPARLAQSDSSS